MRPHVDDVDLIAIREEALRRRRAKTPPIPPDPLSTNPWRFVGPRNTSGRVLCVAVHPHDADTLYVGAALGGVWKSTDGAESWWPLWKDQESLAVGSIAISPSAPEVVYAGTGEPAFGVMFTYPGAGVYVSTDAGATWVLRAGVRSRRIAKVAVAIDDPLTVLVAGNAGLERSRDGGMTWELLAQGFPFDIAVDPHRADRAFVAFSGDALYRLDAGGLTFVNGPMMAEFFTWPKLAIGVDGAHGSDFLLAQSGELLYRTRDGGTTWDRVPTPVLDVQPSYTEMLAVSPTDEDVIAIGHVDAARTSDGGASWHLFAGVHLDHHGVEFARSQPDRVYACTDGGLYRSDDHGATWRHASHGLSITQFYTLELWHRLSTVLIGGTQDNMGCITTGGLTWDAVVGGDVSGVAIDPVDGRTIHALSQHGILVVRHGPRGTWTGVNVPAEIGRTFLGALAQDPTRPDRLYVGQQGIARKVDGVWRLSSSGGGSFYGMSIAIAPSDPDRVYAAGSLILRSDDGGATTPWLDKTSALNPSGQVEASSLAVDPRDRDRVAVGVLGVFNGDLFLTEDGGDTWRSIRGDLAAGRIGSIAFDPADRATLYAGADFGIWRTTDGGVTWHPFDDGLPNAIVMALRMSPERVLYAATYGRGIYRRDLVRATPAVELYVRDSALDTGERLSSPRDLPDPLADNNVYPWESPDIKIDTSPLIERGRVFDGIEFDLLAREGATAGEEVRVYFQVHNRGLHAARNVVARVFAAGASAGLPRLPADFWSAFPDGNPTQPSAWRAIGPPRVIETLHPARPVIVEWRWTPPRYGPTHNCLLGLVTCADDHLASSELDVNALVENDRRACLLNLSVLGVRTPPPPERAVSTVDFHNARYTRDLIDIVVDPRRPRMRVGLVLPKLAGNIELVGVKRKALANHRLPGRWAPGFSPGKLDLDLSTIYELDMQQRAEIRGIELEPGATLRAVVACSGKSMAVPEGAFVIQQRQGKRIVGGCSFELRVRGKR